MTNLSKYCSAFNGCNYCTDLKNVVRKTKTNIAEPKDMVELSNVAVLSNVANITVPSKYRKVLQSYKKSKCVKFAKLAEHSNVAELSNVTVRSNVANIAET